MKRWLAWCLVFLLSGCAANTDLAKQSQRYPWALATASPADTLTGIFAQEFVKELDHLSHGQMKVRIYDNSTLGGDRELLESLASQDVKFVVQNTAPQVLFMPKLALFDLPMAYTNIDQVRQVSEDKDFLKQLDEVYSARGYHLLSLADQDFRLTTSNRPLTRLEDFKGLKIRTMENANHLQFWHNLGANPTPMSFSEVYVGLQQHTIDAQENPIEVIVSSRLYEQQAYLVETNHLPHMLSLLTNQDFYHQLTPHQRKIMDQAAKNARKTTLAQASQRKQERLAILEKAGVKIETLPVELVNELREKNQDLYHAIEKQVNDPQLIQAYLKYADWR